MEMKIACNCLEHLIAQCAFLGIPHNCFHCIYSKMAPSQDRCRDRLPSINRTSCHDVYVVPPRESQDTNQCSWLLWLLNDIVELMHRGIDLHKTFMNLNYACREGNDLVEKTIFYRTAVIIKTEALANNSYTYNVNSFVAVKEGCLQHDCHFWSGKRLKTFEDNEVLVCSLQVHWFEQHERR